MEDYVNDIIVEWVKCVIKGFGIGLKKVEGIGGEFDYYKFGLVFFDENENFNEEVGL